MLTARGAGSLCLVEIALLGPFRNRGIGTMLIRELLDDCARLGQSLSLQVAVGSPAERLYRRLGFTESGRDTMYVRMEQLAGTIETAALPPGIEARGGRHACQDVCAAHPAGDGIIEARGNP
jgi:predicted acetyltransferase